MRAAESAIQMDTPTPKVERLKQASRDRWRLEDQKLVTDQTARRLNLKKVHAFVRHWTLLGRTARTGACRIG